MIGGEHVDVRGDLPDEIIERLVSWEPVANAFCPTGKGGGVDPSCGKVPAHKVSDPKKRKADAAPKAVAWSDPPPKKGKKGVGKAERPKGDESQTKVGDLGEKLAEQLGFRSILPEGKRNFTPEEVAAFGSSIDLEHDHSGKLYELKLCNTTSTEYRLKAKKEEKEAKEQFAKNVQGEAYTLVGVRDADSREVHFYASKKAGLTGAEVNSAAFDYLGKVKY